MTDGAHRRATYADLEAAPAEVVAELIDGELLMSPRPALAHAAVHSTLGGELNYRFHGPGGDGERPGGWFVLDEPELHLGLAVGRHDPQAIVLVPDVAAWRRERVGAMPDTAACQVPPDWVCEVLSPSTHRLDRIRKLALYIDAGVGHVWLVAPAERTIEVYAPTNGVPGRILAWSPEEGPVPRLPPFDEVALDVARWWPEQP